MNVVHVISSISRKSGGTSTYMVNLLNFLFKIFKNTIVCHNDSDSYEFPNEINKLSFSRSPQKIFVVHKTLTRLINSSKIDVFHLNGIWDLILYQSFYVSKKFSIPYVVSTHGMMEPWPLSIGRYKKS